MDIGNDLWSCALGEPRSAPCPLPLLIYRFIHKSHMSDVWAMMSPIFNDLVKNPPRDRNLCPCVKDHKNNGVMDWLDFISKRFYEQRKQKIDPQVFDMEALQDFWTGEEVTGNYCNYNRKRMKFLKPETYAAALFVYCKLKE